MLNFTILGLKISFGVYWVLNLFCSVFSQKYSFKHLPSYHCCNQKSFGSVFSKYANKLMGGILSVYNMPLQPCTCEPAVTFCSWSQGRTFKGMLVFALLNKYSKILEISRSHLCIPVQSVQNNCANSAASHVNYRETVFIHQKYIVIH